MRRQTLTLTQVEGLFAVAWAKKTQKRHQHCVSAGTNNSHAPTGEGELDGVLDETIATGADHKGGPGLDAVLHHHVCSHTAGVQRNLPNHTTGEENIMTAQSPRPLWCFQPTNKHSKHSLWSKAGRTTHKLNSHVNLGVTHRDGWTRTKTLPIDLREGRSRALALDLLLGANVRCWIKTIY